MSAAETVTVHRDVVFAVHEGHRPLALDLYVPSEPRALVVYLHGGGWLRGSRRATPAPHVWWRGEPFERLAAHGLAVACCDYRLSGEAVFPAQLDDVRTALRWLAEHRAAYGVHTERTSLWGCSAGGHLAALAALTGDGDDGSGTRAPRPDSVVCWYPPTDLTALAGDVAEAGGVPDRGPGSRESRLLGAVVDTVPDLARAASPVAHVHPDAPPFLFLHGTVDVDVPLRQSTRLADALTAAGATADVEPVPGAGHVFRELDETALAPLVDRTADFLLTHSGGSSLARSDPRH